MFLSVFLKITLGERLKRFLNIGYEKPIRHKKAVTREIKYGLKLGEGRFVGKYSLRSSIKDICTIQPIEIPTKKENKAIKPKM